MHGDSPVLLFYLLVLLFALLYSMVGHGGASVYLALMSLFSFTPENIRPAALILNLAVSFIAFVQYYRAGHFLWKLFLPLALASVPMAFFGGRMSLDPGIYKKILAVLLLFSSLRLFGLKLNSTSFELKQNPLLFLLIGGSIGLFSGMIGIGGGIILSPVLLLLKWSDVKQTSAVSALFIFVNSLSGLFGLSIHSFQIEEEIKWMLLFACVGGLVGAWLGSKKFNPSFLKKILAFVLVMASAKLLFT
jgi:uncharacterized protein